MALQTWWVIAYGLTPPYEAYFVRPDGADLRKQVQKSCLLGATRMVLSG
ncbi:MAG: hypothetical protein ACO1RA_06875 [Planctomycetaceae bacterium]